MKFSTALFLLFSMICFSGCGSYIDRIHNQLDRETGQARKMRERGDKFAMYRRNNPHNYRRRRPPQGKLSSRHRNVVPPQVKRKYRPSDKAKKRYTADDLNDTGNETSLWSGEGKSNHLFTINDKKQNGDIILINVKTKLRNEITAELKRAFPDPIRKKKKKEDKDQGSPKAAANNKEPASENKESIYDRISSVVIEEINKDHLLLRGRKNVLYKNRKRTIEVQALIPRRDVNDNDEVDSDRIIESSIQVLN